MRQLVAAMVFAALAFPGHVYAQSSMAVGQWVCQSTYTEFDQFGNRTSGFVQNYMLGVQPNGIFAVQGLTAGASGETPFQGQGTWTLQGSFFNARADVQEQSMFSTLPMKFFAVGELASTGQSITSSYETRDPSGSYITTRSNSLCQRQS